MKRVYALLTFRSYLYIMRDLISLEEGLLELYALILIGYQLSS
jgi:hypothetical protein